MQHKLSCKMTHLSQSLQKFILCGLVLLPVAVVAKGNAVHNFASDIKCGFVTVNIKPNFVGSAVEIVPVNKVHSAMVNGLHFARIHRLVFIDYWFKISSKICPFFPRFTLAVEVPDNKPANDRDRHDNDSSYYSWTHWLFVAFLAFIWGAAANVLWHEGRDLLESIKSRLKLSVKFWHKP